MLKSTIERFYHIEAKVIDKIFKKYDHHIQYIFDYFKKIAKKEDIAAQELIEVD